MESFWAYVLSNPLGAGLICALGAFVIATLSALVAAMRGGAGRIFGEYQALGRSLSDSRRAQQAQTAALNELRNRVADLQAKTETERSGPEEPTRDPNE